MSEHETSLPDSASPDAMPAIAPRTTASAPETASPPPSESWFWQADEEMKRISRRSFLWAGVVGVAGFSAWKWLISRPKAGELPWPFRQALEVNGRIGQDLFASSRLAPTFPRARAGEPKPNGDVGLGDDFDPETWSLFIEGGSDAEGKPLSDPQEITLAQIHALPRYEMVTELKCIEGWSQVVHWAGARLADLIAKYPPTTVSGKPPDVKNRPNDLLPYVSMATPDAAYYVGLDMASALHPQTLLCYEMNGAPLTSDHGAPLRLAIPVKYGIKNIKRIGTIRYASQQPADYWAEQGYDWYAGH